MLQKAPNSACYIMPSPVIYCGIYWYIKVNIMVALEKNYLKVITICFVASEITREWNITVQSFF